MLLKIQSLKLRVLLPVALLYLVLVLAASVIIGVDLWEMSSQRYEAVAKQNIQSITHQIDNQIELRTSLLVKQSKRHIPHSKTHTDPQAVLAPYYALRPLFNGFVLLDQTGKVAVEDRRLVHRIPVAFAKEIFYKSQKLGQVGVHVDGPYCPKTSTFFQKEDTCQLLYSVPLLDASHHMVGMVIASVYLNDASLGQYIKNIHVHDQAILSLAQQGQNSHFFSTKSEWMTIALNPYEKQLVASLDPGHKVPAIISDKKQSQLVLVMPLSSMPWNVFLQANLESREAIFWRYIKRITVLSLLTLLLFLPLLWLWLKSVFSPLKDLTKQLNLSEGGEQPLPAKTGIEELDTLLVALQSAKDKQDAYQYEKDQLLLYAKSMQEALPYGVLVCKTSGEMVFANQHIETHLGFCIDVINPQNWLDWVVADEVKMVRQRWQAFIDGEAVEKIVCHIVPTNHDEPLPVTLHCLSLIKEYCVYLIKDVCSETQKRQKVHQERQLACQILADVQDWVCIFDEYGRLDWGNLAFNEWLDVSERDYSTIHFGQQFVLKNLTTQLVVEWPEMKILPDSGAAFIAQYQLAHLGEVKVMIYQMPCCQHQRHIYALVIKPLPQEHQSPKSDFAIQVDKSFLKQQFASALQQVFQDMAHGERYSLHCISLNDLPKIQRQAGELVSQRFLQNLIASLWQQPSQSRSIFTWGQYHLVVLAHLDDAGSSIQEGFFLENRICAFQLNYLGEVLKTDITIHDIQIQDGDLILEKVLQVENLCSEDFDL